MIKTLTVILLSIFMLTVGVISLYNYTQEHSSGLRILFLILSWLLTVPAFVWWYDFFEKHLK